MPHTSVPWPAILRPATGVSKGSTTGSQGMEWMSTGARVSNWVRMPNNLNPLNRRPGHTHTHSLHVVEAPPPHLGMRRRIAVHLEQHDAEEAVPVLANHRNVEGGGWCLDLRGRAKRASLLAAAPSPASLLCPPGRWSTGGGGNCRQFATAGSPMEGRVFNRFCRCLGLSPQSSDPG
jgi:hypothetical protein